jgi:hypothetical protein
MLGRREFPPRWQRALVAEWRAACRDPQRAAAKGGRAAESLPAWKEAKLLAAEIAAHPANPKGANFVGFASLTSDQRQDFEKKRARLKELESTAAGEGGAR